MAGTGPSFKERVPPVIRAIFEEHIRPAPEALNDEGPDLRDEATKRLIDFGPAVVPCVEEHRRASKGDLEAESRCAAILDALR